MIDSYLSEMSPVGYTALLRKQQRQIPLRQDVSFKVSVETSQERPLDKGQRALALAVSQKIHKENHDECIKVSPSAQYVHKYIHLMASRTEKKAAKEL